VGRGHHLAAVAAAALIVLPAPAGAAAEQGRLVDFSLRFTNTRPASPTGLSLHAKALGEGKPSPLRSVVYTVPRGTRFDDRAMPRCEASDLELEVLGSAACPDSSFLALGKLTAISGLGAPVDPVMADVHVFNAPAQILEVVTFPGTPASPAFDRVTINGTTLTAHPPKAPGGPPDGEMAITSLDYTFAPRVSSAGSLVTTPPTCPRSGAWTTTGTFTFANGASETVASRSPCRGRKRRARRS
jgi:hypothetical protein